ncbi:MAG: hypothetical protein LC737_05360 [Chloroflexi bacterium]|nr:hypothetical protein [Chloroflexota bacterium]
MTYDEAVQLIRELMSATSKEELQTRIGDNLPRVDATFFQTVNQVVTRLHTQGKHDAARHLSAIGDSLARLRFII